MESAGGGKHDLAVLPGPGLFGVLAVRQAEMVTNRGFCRFNFGPDERLAVKSAYKTLFG
jgi:hypothetical protein